ncbi:MAG: hypothetical protein WBI20_08840 [Burkholderiaceae bacterium]
MKSRQRPYVPALLIGLAVLSCWLTVQAQPLPAPALNPATPGAAAPAARHYTPKAGESLDRVIANTLADSPLKIELLRQAYVEQNPSAFLPGKMPQLRKGVVLSVPDPEQLLQKYAPPKPSVSAAQQPAPSSSSEERRRWVQYP